MQRETINSEQHASQALPHEDASLVLLGEITGVHGLRGCLRLKSFTEPSEGIFDYPLVNTKGKAHPPITFQHKKGPEMLIVRIEGVHSRQDAETLKGTRLYTHKDQLPTPEEDEYYVRDLVGLSVKDRQGNVLGVIKTVENYGARDVCDLQLKDGTMGTLSFDELSVLDVDLKGRSITIDETRLLTS